MPMSGSGTLASTAPLSITCQSNTGPKKRRTGMASNTVSALAASAYGRPSDMGAPGETSRSSVDIGKTPKEYKLMP